MKMILNLHMPVRLSRIDQLHMYILTNAFFLS